VTEVGSVTVFLDAERAQHGPAQGQYRSSCRPLLIHTKFTLLRLVAPNGPTCLAWKYLRHMILIWGHTRSPWALRVLIGQALCASRFIHWPVCSMPLTFGQTAPLF